MRILYLGNNWLGWKVLQWLEEQGEEVVGLVLHPSEKQKYAKQLLDTADLPSESIIEAERLQETETLSGIRKLNPDIAISVLFDYILKPSFITLFEKGVINLHPAYLPYNRGQYPNVWSIVEGTPAGTTLHYIDESIDTGDIIGRKQVEIESIDTGKTLYHKLENASVELFKELWPKVKKETAPRIPQDTGTGTYHRTEDVDQIDEIDLDARYTARELINILRARTFPPHEGAYFEADGKRVYMRINLEYGDE